MRIHGYIAISPCRQVRRFADCGFGLVLAGHLHGGLIRIPFVGGIVTAEGEIDFNQKYEGMYTVNKTTLISSKGLAPSRRSNFQPARSGLLPPQGN